MQLKFFGKIKHSAQLIRLPNLLITVLTQTLVYYYLIYLPANQIGKDLILSPTLFFLLAISTFCIMAGGYVINDIIDHEVDLINKPSRSLMNKFVSKNQARAIYLCWNIAGLIATSVLTIQLNQSGIGVVIFGTAIALYLYSKYFQGVILIGNLVVALLCGLVIWIIQFAGQKDLLGSASSHIFIFGAFAFIITLWREVIKDLQDVEGDKRYDLKTLAQVANGRYSITLSRLIGVLIVNGIFWVLLSNWHVVNHTTKIYGLGLVATATLITYKLFSKQVRTQFKSISIYQKLFMVQGILIILFWHG